MASTGVGVAGRVGFYCAHIEGYLVMSVGASMELASGMHRDADGRHRHAQPWNLAHMGTSRPVCTRLWVKPSATPSRTSVCVPPRVPCVSRHIKPDHARATIAPERARARGLVNVQAFLESVHRSVKTTLAISAPPARPVSRP